MPTPKSSKRELLIAILGLAIAATSAWSMKDRVRLVDIITLFFGGVAAGVSLGIAIARHRMPKGGA